MKELLELYVSFLRIGGLTFGGGLAMLPMLKFELVEKRKWISEEELLDCYAIGQCTPGIIAINTATFVGYKKKKVLGGIFSTLGMVTPSLVIITIVAQFLKAYMENVWVRHAFNGVRGAVCALMINTVFSLAKKNLKNAFSFIVCGLAIIAAMFSPIPTVVIVIIAAIIGIIFEKIKEAKNNA